MPSAGLLALLDDITSLLDDVATMTKVATKKTAGVIGDDLALNANQLAGMCAARELPIVAAVAKGSLINKAILIPIALLITAFVPSLVQPLLMAGGAFLCFEGVEKIFHRARNTPEKGGDNEMVTPADPARLERERVKSAIVTDFILSAEILVIALGTASGSSLLVQAITLIAIGLAMTIVVYGSVALIIKADDVGLVLQASEGESPLAQFSRGVGKGILLGAPKLMKILSFLGTTAMFLVGGEIIAHSVPGLHHAISSLALTIREIAPLVSGILTGVLTLFTTVALGIAVGLVTMVLVRGVGVLRP